MPRPRTRPTLDAVETKLLAFLARSIRARGGPPTLQEIATEFGWSSTRAAGYRLERLEAKGYVTRKGDGWRWLRVADDPAPPDAREAGPPIVGRVAAGEPIPPGDWDGDRLRLGDLFPGDDIFAMRVRGDSMVDAHIQNGDYVLVRRQPDAPDGDKVVCLIDGAVTLKVIRRDRGGVWLHPCSARHRPFRIEPGQESCVLGVLVGVVHKEG